MFEGRRVRGGRSWPTSACVAHAARSLLVGAPMSAEVFGPAATWPEHQKPHWKVALKRAREAGWTLKYLNSHWWGVLECPGGVCVLNVDKTARGGETKAREVPKRLRQCTHGAPPPPASAAQHRAAHCDHLLDQAGDVLATAALELDHAARAQAAAADLDAAMSAPDADESGWEEAYERVQAIGLARSSSAIALRFEEAGALLDEVDAIVRHLRRSAYANPVLARASRLRDEIEDGRSRLVQI